MACQILSELDSGTSKGHIMQVGIAFTDHARVGGRPEVAPRIGMLAHSGAVRYSF
jgi:hypothetical protein